MNWKILPCLVIGVTLMNVNSAQAQTQLFVAPNGDDANPGTLAKPFATLEKARDTLRALRAAGKNMAGVDVMLRGGTYFLKQPFVLLPEDSGQGTAPIIFQAYGEEKPLLSGGQPIKMTRDGRIWRRSQLI